MFSCCGLGLLEGGPTDWWLTNVLTDAKLYNFDLRYVADFVRVRLTDAIRSLPGEDGDRRCSFAIAAFVNGHPYAGLISNWEDLTGRETKAAADRAEVYWDDCSDRADTPQFVVHHAFGMHAAVLDLDFLPHANQFPSAEDLCLHAGDMMPEAHESPLSCGFVGPDCLVTWITPAGANAECRHYHAGKIPAITAPHFVSDFISVYDFRVSTTREGNRYEGPLPD